MTTLWIHQGGRVACETHMGAEGEAAARRSPSAKSLRTPLGNWTRVSDLVAAEWDRQMGEPITCDDCGATYR